MTSSDQFGSKAEFINKEHCLLI